MKFSGGVICGEKRQGKHFQQTGPAKGSYPVYVCNIKITPGSAHRGNHYDSVLKVRFN